MRKNIKLFNSIIFISILLLTSAKAGVANKVILSVGSEIITNYDIAREIKYLNVITLGKFKNLDNQEVKKIAVESLIKDKIKTNALTNYNDIIINEKLINNQMLVSALNLGFTNEEDLNTFLSIEEYEMDEFRKKLILELKWNQLIYQFYKNQIVVNKDKIDQKLKTLISKQKKREEYLIYEIFIEDSSIRQLNEEPEEVLVKEKRSKGWNLKNGDNEKEKNVILIEAEIASYDNKENLSSVKKLEETRIDEKKKNSQITIEELLQNIKRTRFRKYRNSI